MFKNKKIVAALFLAMVIGLSPFLASKIYADDVVVKSISNIAPKSGQAEIVAIPERDFKYNQAKERFPADDIDAFDPAADGVVMPEGTIDKFSEYLLGPEDKLKITVFGEKELSTDYRVGSDGTIAFPLIGEIQVNGLTIRQAEDILKTKLQEGYLKKPSVSIEITESRPFYILGEVRRPGSYNYISGMNVLQAVAISGGFTYRANRKSVEILRGAAAPSEPLTAATEDAVKPGDIIFIRERFF